MSKVCINCGNELKDSAKFCGKCGAKVEEITSAKTSSNESFVCPNCKNNLRSGAVYCDICGCRVNKYPKEIKCRSCGNELREGALFCDVCGCPSDKMGQDQVRNDNESMHKNKTSEKISTFFTAIKDHKIGSVGKKKSIIIALSGVIVIIAIFLAVLIPNLSGISDEDVAQAALQLAENDVGFKLELTSYDVIDSFTAKTENLMSGESVKAEMYLVIVEADIKDDSGNIVESVKYGVSVVDPEKSEGQVFCSPMSKAQDFTGADNKEIETQLRSATAKFR